MLLVLVQAEAQEIAGSWHGQISVNGKPTLKATLILTQANTFVFTSIANVGNSIENRVQTTGTYQINNKQIIRHIESCEPEKGCTNIKGDVIETYEFNGKNSLTLTDTDKSFGFVQTLLKRDKP